jgi:hypothetical protein
MLQDLTPPTSIRSAVKAAFLSLNCTCTTQVVDACDKLSVLEKYEAQLESELSQQEVLVAEHSVLVNQVTREIDVALEAAQRRYRDALAEVRRDRGTPSSRACQMNITIPLAA